MKTYTHVWYSQPIINKTYVTYIHLFYYSPTFKLRCRARVFHFVTSTSFKHQLYRLSSDFSPNTLALSITIHTMIVLDRSGYNKTYSVCIICNKSLSSKCCKLSGLRSGYLQGYYHFFKLLFWNLYFFFNHLRVS